MYTSTRTLARELQAHVECLRPDLEGVRRKVGALGISDRQQAYTLTALDERVKRLEQQMEALLHHFGLKVTERPEPPTILEVKHIGDKES